MLIDSGNPRSAVSRMRVSELFRDNQKKVSCDLANQFADLNQFRVSPVLASVEVMFK